VEVPGSGFPEIQVQLFIEAAQSLGEISSNGLKSVLYLFAASYRKLPVIITLLPERS